MSCYHPLLMLPRYVDGGRFGFQRAKTKNGKDAYVIVKDSELEYETLKNWPGAFLAPCGHCLGCQLDYSRTWADRLLMELQYHDSAYFVTLTYDDDHVPRVVADYKDDGTPIEHLSLVKRDAQLWMKRLRKQFSNDKIRFFLAGEYGSKTFRPHYHAIVFGLHLGDLQLLKKSALGDDYYVSPRLSRTWPNGFSMVAAVTWQSCAYVTRYVTKKVGTGKRFDYEHAGIEPPFSLMSNRPGLGLQYYLDHPEMMETGETYISTEDGSRTVKAPRYFYKHLERDNPELFAALSETRAKKAHENIVGISQRVDYDHHSDYLAVCERHKQQVVKSLKREEI